MLPNITVKIILLDPLHHSHIYAVGVFLAFLNKTFSLSELSWPSRVTVDLDMTLATLVSLAVYHLHTAS